MRVRRVVGKHRGVLSFDRWGRWFVQRSESTRVERSHLYKGIDKQIGMSQCWRSNRRVGCFDSSKSEGDNRELWIVLFLTWIDWYLLLVCWKGYIHIENCRHRNCKCIDNSLWKEWKTNSVLRLTLFKESPFQQNYIGLLGSYCEGFNCFSMCHRGFSLKCLWDIR